MGVRPETHATLAGAKRTCAHYFGFTACPERSMITKRRSPGSASISHSCSAANRQYERGRVLCTWSVSLERQLLFPQRKGRKQFVQITPGSR